MADVRNRRPSGQKSESESMQRENKGSLSPRLPINVIASFLLGVIELGLALNSGHTFGAVSGIVGIGASMVVCFKQSGPRKELLSKWISVFSWALLIFVLIRVSTLQIDARYGNFPEKCLVSEKGCVRVVGDGHKSHRNGELKPLHFQHVSANDVAKLIKLWRYQSFARQIIQESSNSEEKSITIHAQELTRIMGFPDNLSIKIKCVGESVVVFVHSELRLGKGDLGANFARIKALFHFLQSEAPGLQTTSKSNCWDQ
eukprot:TRINITY_DN9664_c1_g2_i1.p1 TRINITY_DN9664_c1_g2~~TRINITY_DN9664_c1_g2_i1.p1  ORF type:complete len:258 (+),score=53.26 TRINITY_DN9664_c1_g2_i1:563-1336(+)